MLILLNIMDAITTLIALKNPNVMEGNPLMLILLNNPFLFVFLKVVVVTLIIIYLYLRIRKNVENSTFGHNKDLIMCRIGGVCLTLSIAFYIVVQWNNISMI